MLKNGKEMTLGHKLKSTQGQELWAINGEEIILGHKLNTSLCQDLRALNGKEMTLDHKIKLKKNVSGSRVLGSKQKRNDFRS